MSASETVHEDSSRLSFADRTFFRFESFLNLAGGVVIFLLVFLATANVLGRWIFSLPIDGYVDWVEQAMAFIAFLGIAYTKRLGGHIRMDMMIGRLRGRVLWSVELLSVCLMFLVTLVLIYGSWLHFFARLHHRRLIHGYRSADMASKLVVPFALTVLALRLILQMWGYLRAIKEGSDEPIGVPLVESAAAVAAKEAESLLGDIDNNKRGA